MQSMINVQSTNFTGDTKLITSFTEKLKKLFSLYDRITSINVFLSLENKKQSIKNKVVKIKLAIPGKVIFCEGKVSKDFAVTFESAYGGITTALKKAKAAA